MSKISDFLASLTGRPKNFDAAAASLIEAKTQLDSVNALFSAAGLNLDQLLAAGPDSLKAHLASLDNSDQIKALTERTEKLESEAKALTENTAAQVKAVEAITAQLSAFNSIASTIGLATTEGMKSTPDQITAAFSAHVAKQTTLALAKTGHPPVTVISTEVETIAATPESDAKLYAEYSAMKPGPARLAFYDQNLAALTRAHRAAPAA